MCDMQTVNDKWKNAFYFFLVIVNRPLSNYFSATIVINDFVMFVTNLFIALFIRVIAAGVVVGRSIRWQSRFRKWQNTTANVLKKIKITNSLVVKWLNRVIVSFAANKGWKFEVCRIKRRRDRNKIIKHYASTAKTKAKKRNIEFLIALFTQKQSIASIVNDIVS